MTNVAILGGSGYTAVELLKVLPRHPKARIEAVTARQGGRPPSPCYIHRCLAQRPERAADGQRR
ncbi:MAG TPA: hypothetical protein VM597_36340 [Gemmataceae bacterium]|nr:hypothetical protein [Gemmataceae bacterium]